MDYNEIVTAYKNGTLDTSDIKRRLEGSMALKPRTFFPSQEFIEWGYRTLDTDHNIKPSEDKGELEKFERKSKWVINATFEAAFNRVNNSNAWELIGLKPEDFSKEKFKAASLVEKFSMIRTLFQRHNEYFEYEKIASLRHEIVGDSKDVDDEMLIKMAFLKSMFDSYTDKNVKRRLVDINDEDYFSHFLDYSKRKHKNIKGYAKTKGKYVISKYKKLEERVNDKDYEDIIKVISRISKATGLSKIKVMKIFMQLSRTDFEQGILESEIRSMRDLEEKCATMQAIKDEIERKQRLADEEKRIAEELRKTQEEKERRALEARQREIEKQMERIIGETEGYTGEFDRRIEELKQTITAKESVYPIFLSWINREDITLSKGIGDKKLQSLFEKIKRIQKATGRRVSLFLITNADQEVTKKRWEDLKEQSEKAGLPKLVEGALGGYASFRINEKGEIIDVATMSPENREKIKTLLHNGIHVNMAPEWVDETEQNYIRYKLADKPDKTLPMDYLKFLIRGLLDDKRISSQPIEFQPFIEKKAVGIDVVLASQAIGISKSLEYYEAKYNMEKGKINFVNVDDIDKFLGEKEDIVH